jgi:hypothetical protein
MVLQAQKNGDGATVHRRRPSGCGQRQLRFSARVRRHPACFVWVGPPLGNIIHIGGPSVELYSIPHNPEIVAIRQHVHNHHNNP